MGQRETEIDSPSAAGDLFDDPRVWEVVSAFQEDLKAGRKPDRAAYLARYPELVEVIAESLDGLLMLHSGLCSSSPRAVAQQRPTDTAIRHSTAPLGDFQIVGEIARGGMGVVYEAVQLSLGRRVALKVLPFASTLDPRHLQRFKIEAQAAALLHHTHIVPIYAVGCERGVHFYAMQLIEGQSLAAVLQGLRLQEGREAKRGPSSNIFDTSDTQDPQVNLDGAVPSAALHSTANVSAAVTAGNAIASEGYLRRVVRLMIQAADALEHAHQSGVVHRDIKPANLLIDRAGNLWITDFGLAQLQSDNGVTRSSDMLGTFRYMSPEQTGGQRAVLDHRTDIYSLGATFYELVTLEPAFAADSHQELFYNILHAEPRRPRELNRALPQELETIILKSLSKNPAERYATAADLVSDLQRYLDHKPILARPPSLVDRVRKWSRRNPSVVVASMVLLVLVAVGSLIGNWLISQEQIKTANALAGQKLRADEAEARFDQARHAVDALFQISEEELTDKPVEQARMRILEVVLAHYEDFIEQRSGDEKSQAELALVQTKVKGILHELNVLQKGMDHRLLERPVVQDELHLSADQKERLATLLKQWETQGRRFFELLRDLPEAERRAKIVAIVESKEQALQELLSADQHTRFEQLAIQSRGLFAFKDHNVIRSLGLTSEQRSQIREIEHQMFAEHHRPRGPGGDRGPPGPPRPEDQESKGPRPDVSFPAGEREPKDGRPPQRTPMKVWVEKVLGLLSEEQLQIWQSLIGEPFSEPESGPFH